ncbi:MAG: enoyl-CoA hydratase [Glaciecola sp.]|jgi:enoyl-CoA hydratase
MALVDRDDRAAGVVVLTFNDPDRRNAMTEAMGDAIAAAFADLDGDQDVRAVVLTGAPPAFSAGGDLDMLQELGRRARDEDFDASPFMREFYERFLSVRRCPVPVIAAINGHAVGAGLCVALACDLRIVANEAKVGLNFARLGLHPGMGGSWLLPRAVGVQRGAEMLYTGRLVSGADFARWGAALEAVPADEVLAAALELAGQIAASSPEVVRQLRVSLAASPTSSLEDQLAAEADAQAVNYASPQFTEGLAAVRERRSAQF